MMVKWWFAAAFTSLPVWIGEIDQDIATEVTYSGAVGEYLIKGKCNLVTGTHPKVVVISVSCNGWVLVAARRVSYASANSAVTMNLKESFWLCTSHSVTLGSPGFMYSVTISWDRTGGVFSNTGRCV